ncbi:uncharacterized protein Hap1MRO34_017370 isoform 2-T2 [Clarias gariepinus]
MSCCERVKRGFYGTKVRELGKSQPSVHTHTATGAPTGNEEEEEEEDEEDGGGVKITPDFNFGLIHQLPSEIAGGLEPIPGDLGHEAGYTLAKQDFY